MNLKVATFVISFHCLLQGSLSAVAATPTPAAPSFKEVYELLKTNLPAITEQELNRAAVEGLIKELSPRVTLLDATNGIATETARGTNNAALNSEALLDDYYGYLRVSRVETGLVAQVQSAVRQLTTTNKVRGLVLDLRFADGRDYASAAAVADLFLDSEEPLLDWGGKSARATLKKEPIKLPVVVLMNQKTAGAAEALAAILRETRTALLIGTNTAGEANVMRDFRLTDGRQLRVAIAGLKVGHGETLATTGLKPDILVEVDPADEKIHFADAYRVLPKANSVVNTNLVTNLSVTNRSPRRRLNEAELVRMMREGQETEEEGRVAKLAEPLTPVIHDPALARAIDLLKGLAVVRHSRF